MSLGGGVGVKTGVESDEVLHSEDTVHVTGIETNSISLVPNFTLILKEWTYPKKIPPNDAKTQSMYALSVTGASTLSGLDGPTAPFTVIVSPVHVLRVV